MEIVEQLMKNTLKIQRKSMCFEKIEFQDLTENRMFQFDVVIKLSNPGSLHNGSTTCHIEVFV